MIDKSYIDFIKDKVYNQDEALQFFESLLEVHPHKDTLLSYLNPRRFLLLLELGERSSCIKKLILRHPTIFEETIPELWYKVKSKETYLKEINELYKHSDMSFEEFLAFYRRRELMRLVAKDILNTEDLEDILLEYSALADALIESLIKHISNDNAKELLVIGMGKLGSNELNFYSDIDVMFFSKDNTQYYDNICKLFMKSINTNTKEGEIYITDADLRPFGKSGPIVMSIEAAEDYYEMYGRFWERMALVRARAVYDESSLFSSFYKNIIIPFVFKKSIDQRDLDNIALMKEKIELEQKKKTLSKGYNVKTGEGGIREVEFSLQAMALLLGGKKPLLRDGNTYRLIMKLEQNGILSEEEGNSLKEAYTFLRRLEHLIQIKNCVQDHVLKDQDVEKFAFFMGFSKDKFNSLLSLHRSRVREIFDNLLPKSRKKVSLNPCQEAVILEDVEVFSQCIPNVKNPKNFFNSLLGIFQGKEGIYLSEKERQKFLEYLPTFIKKINSSKEPELILRNLEKFIMSKTGRRIIFEKESIFESLLDIFEASNTISTEISRYPDTVEDILTLYQDFPTKEEIKRDLDNYKGVELDKLNLFRRFKRAWEIRIILNYITKSKNLIKLFESLSELAEVVLEGSFELRENTLLIALGKLGSKELNINSDLDLCFVVKDNQTKISSINYIQDFIKFLTTHTKEGYLYAVDFRLRPMGQKGELNPTLDFYKNYFENEARFWERLSWTRYRVITGDKELKKEFEHIVNKFLFEKDITEKEAQETLNMKFEIEKNLKYSKDKINIKLASGSMMDAEFITQLYILKEKLREPSMLKAMDILKNTYPFFERLKELYLYLRSLETSLRLKREGSTSTLSIMDFGEKTFNETKDVMKEIRSIFLENINKSFATNLTYII